MGVVCCPVESRQLRIGLPRPSGGQKLPGADAQSSSSGNDSFFATATAVSPPSAA